MHYRIEKFIRDIEKDIEAFRARNKISRTRFCRLAGNNPRLLSRIKSENVTVATLDKALNFMESHEKNAPKTG